MDKPVHFFVILSIDKTFYFGGPMDLVQERGVISTGSEINFLIRAPTGDQV